MARIQRKTFLKYTGLFLVLAAIIFIPFVIEGKSFIHQGDGFHQHYPFFREYLQMLRTFFQTGDWQQWDWSIGLGQDTLLTYGYYVVGDPFVYLGLLFPAGSEELAFHAVMFVRVWAVGASFLLYARKMNFGEMSALIASILYAFCHYTIYNVVRHPFFIHPLIFLPLIALGIEKIYRKESGAFFAVIVSLAAISNFYFFYMLTLMAFLYAVIRYPDYGKGWKIFGQYFLKFLLFYLIGVLLSSVVFLPQVYGFLSASRSPNFPPISLLFYPINYYVLLLLNLVTPGTIFWSVGGLSIVAVLTLPFLARKRREVPGLFWSLILLTILLLFPFLGSFMNGLSAPYNRFTFVFPFYLALALVYFLEHLDEMKAKDLVWMKRFMIFLTVVYGVATFVTFDYVLYLTPLVVGWLAYAVWLCQYRELFNRKQLNRLVLGLVVVNVISNALVFYLPFGKHAMNGTIDYGTIDETYETIFGEIEEKLPEDEWYRVGVTSMDAQIRNHYIYLDINGLNSYASLTNGHVSDFARTMENSHYEIIQPLRGGVDDRRFVNQLLGVRYILTDFSNAQYIPAGYVMNEALSEPENNLLVAETANAAPFAFVETDFISAEDFEAIHPVVRESVLAEAVVVEEEYANLEPLSILPTLLSHEGNWVTFDGVDIDAELELGESLSFEVVKEDSELVLHFDDPERFLNQEVFLYIEGITYTPPETLPGAQVNTGYQIETLFNNQSKNISQKNQYSFSSYYNRENVLIHLNEVKQPQSSMGLRFDDVGHYAFENVTVVSRPYDPSQAASDADHRKRNGMELVDFSDESVKGTVETDGGILVTSMPFSRGWTCLVNGEEVPLEKVNVGFIGVPLDSGTHTIEFIYETPLLKVGLVLTIVGIVGLIVVHYKMKGQDK